MNQPIQGPFTDREIIGLTFENVQNGWGFVLSLSFNNNNKKKVSPGSPAKEKQPL